MNSEFDLRCDVAVIGAGPAGIAAATVAAECGASVVLIDDNPNPGGQIWRGENHSSKHANAAQWFKRLEQAPIKWLRSTRVFHATSEELFAESNDATHHISFDKLILATGAREQFLPFPGWTLPNVMGAGALQALIKSGLPVNGKRIVVAGTGPLLLAVAAYARGKGANVLGIAEQATWSKFLGFGISVLTSPAKLQDALRFTWQLRGISHWKNSWPVAAIGNDRLEAVRISHNGKTKEIPCDYLTCGFHLIPNLELPRYMGCAIRNGFVTVDENQQTSITNIFCAGETTGIGGFERSRLEGQIAGYAVANKIHEATALQSQRAATQRHVQAMTRAFALRDELKHLAQNDTLVCRCEDVPFSQLRKQTSWRAAKLHTRCGMGPCQGRICGAASEFLFGWNTGSSRPPLFPVSCASLAAIESKTLSESFQGGSK
jgi:NADPH-dependent 2,4-dienoyl-CoA reductase/sulfur reductase-like enzyme